MVRLPQPGADNGNWGSILNDYLSTAHNADGTVKDNTITSAQLKDGSVTATKLSSSSVDTAAIAPAAITKPLLSSGLQSEIDAKITQSTADATFTQQWRPSTVYVANKVVVLPNGVVGIRTSNGTSRSSFDAAELLLWTVAPSTEANIELAYAEVMGKRPMDTSGTFTDSAGMAITFETGARPAMVDCYVSSFYGDNEATWGFRVVRDDAQIMAEGVLNTSVAVGYPPSPSLKFRVPANTPSHTYRLQTNRWVGSGFGEFNTQERTAYMSAISV